MIFANYDQQTGKVLGFYDDGIHLAVPEPAVPVAPAVWQDAIKFPGKYVVQNGILVATAGFVGVTEQELKAMKVRAIRDQLLAACDWTQGTDAPITPEKVAAWKVYRQALRDLPNKADFDLDNPQWPQRPQ